MACSRSVLIKCAVGKCANHGVPNAAGCRQGKRRRVPAYLCGWCVGIKGTWTQRRTAAGLPIRSAAQLLGVQPGELAAIETGFTTPTAAFADRMARLYRGESV